MPVVSDSTRLPAAAAATLALAFAAGCSFGNIGRDECTSDNQCVQAFGADSMCGSGGFCVEGSAPPPTASDRCQVGDVPVRASSDVEFDLDTTDLSDDVRELSSCIEHDTDGNDGFFAVDMQAGQRWHFHVSVPEGDSGSNPAVYVLPNCDERSCQPGDAIDECLDGSDEHLSFAAPRAGQYIVGVDSRSEGGAGYTVLAVAPVCGNGGMPEHSETCEDGNVTPGDGCDDQCRAELTEALPDEQEPNDDVYGANVVLIDGGVGELTVEGRMGGRCDFDMYKVAVPQGGAIEAHLLNATGGECTGAVPSTLKMTFLSADGLTVLGEGAPGGTNLCPVIDDTATFARDLDAGDYHIRVTSGEDDQSLFNYRLRLMVSEPGV